MGEDFSEVPCGPSERSPLHSSSNWFDWSVRLRPPSLRTSRSRLASRLSPGFSCCHRSVACCGLATGRRDTKVQVAAPRASTRWQSLTAKPTDVPSAPSAAVPGGFQSSPSNAFRSWRDLRHALLGFVAGWAWECDVLSVFVSRNGTASRRWMVCAVGGLVHTRTEPTGLGLWALGWRSVMARSEDLLRAEHQGRSEQRPWWHGWNRRHGLHERRRQCPPAAPSHRSASRAA